MFVYEVKQRKVNPNIEVSGLYGETVHFWDFRGEDKFFYFGFVASLRPESLDSNDMKTLNCRYDAQISVLAHKPPKKREEAKTFVVGFGVLLCEFLKNLALIGVCCGVKRKLTITDDDVTEKSNLRRQFLFCDRNIGQAKSSVASVASLIYSHVRLEALQSHASPETESVYNDTLWENLSVVINVLDNVNAKLYTYQRCLYFQKLLLEPGTLRANCSTQMATPHHTENYSASRDSSHFHFLLAASIFSDETFGIPFPDWVKPPQKLAEAVDKVIVPDFQLMEDVKIVTDEKATGISTSLIDDAAVNYELVMKLETCQKLPSGYMMNPIQFGKALLKSSLLTKSFNLEFDLPAGYKPVRVKWKDPDKCNVCYMDEWVAEGEKYVKVVCLLASKVVLSVVSVDEVWASVPSESINVTELL